MNVQLDLLDFLKFLKRKIGVVLLLLLVLLCSVFVGRKAFHQKENYVVDLYYTVDTHTMDMSHGYAGVTDFTYRQMMEYITLLKSESVKKELNKQVTTEVKIVSGSQIIWIHAVSDHTEKLEEFKSVLDRKIVDLTQKNALPLALKKLNRDDDTIEKESDERSRKNSNSLVLLAGLLGLVGVMLIVYFVEKRKTSN